MADRFAKALKDPKFQSIPKKSTKLEIDERFEKMFTGKQFKEKYTVDKYGRKVKNQDSADNLKKFYRLKGAEVPAEKAGKAEAAKAKENGKAKPKATTSHDDNGSDEEDGEDEESEEEDGDSEEDGDEDEEEEDEDEEDGEEVYDPMRGIGVDSSSSESDSEEEMSGEDEEYPEEDDAIFDKIAEEKASVPLGDATKRFAVVEMDWDRIRAVDLMKLFASFTPRGSTVLSVKIIPSEFGKERIAQEQINGPPKEIFRKVEEKEGGEEDGSVEGANKKTKKGKKGKGNKEDGKGKDKKDGGIPEKEKRGSDNVLDHLLHEVDENDEFDPEALRKYQLDRLKYYFAVVEFDSVEAADHVYDQCNGLEFENTSNVLDLRFIPDDMVFDEPPKDVATEAPAEYKPTKFETKALQHSKVNLTWDEDPYERVLITKKKFTKDDLDNLDLNAYVASSGESDSDTDPTEKKRKMRDKYKALLSEVAVEEQPDQEMEITFTSGLSEVATELLNKKKEKEKKNDQTLWESYLDKKKQLKKERKKKLKALKNGEQQDNSGEESDDIPDDVKNDPFFAEAFEDKAGSKGKKLKGKKAKEEDEEEEKKRKAELELLLMDENEGADQKKHFNLKEIIKAESSKKKKKKGKEGAVVQDTFKADLHDPRFEAIYNSHHFGLDPSDPRFKNTKAMKSFIEERQRQQTSKMEKEESLGAKKQATSEKPKSSDLSVLVDSVKRKTASSFSSKGKRQKLDE